MRWLRRLLFLILILLLGPLAAAARGDVNVARDWSRASRESSGLAPPPATTPEAVVQVYAARTFGWRGAFAVHTWISLKPAKADQYTTYEVIGWYAFGGARALQIHHNGPDRYWFGARPEVLAELRGAKAAAAIEKIKRAALSYPYADTYRTFPGPNSNTFVAYVTREVPELGVDLPPTAVGKDFLANGDVVGTPPSGRGVQVSLLGVLGFILSPVEGIEFNLFGLDFGFKPTGPALRLPGLGTVGP